MSSTGPDPDVGAATTVPGVHLGLPGGGQRPAVVPAPRAAPDQAPQASAGWTGSFEDFFKAEYRTLLRQARYSGADAHEADDAAAATMADVYRNWDRLDDPLAWARRAVVRFFIKAKMRNLERIRALQVRYHAGTPHGSADANLTSWEEWQLVRQLVLESLTIDQQRVMALILDGYTPAEIAVMIDATPGAVRQRLCLARKSLALRWRERNDVGPGSNELKGTP